MNLPIQVDTRRAEYVLEQADFERIAIIAKSGWGLNIDKAKKPLIKSRLSKRLRVLGLASFNEYCDIIEVGNEDEIEHFVMTLTTNVTHFYREVHHFDNLETNILPSLISRAKAGERVRIWSAGCSSGKEPYSIAGSILSLDPNAGKYDLKVLASDIDPDVLQTAQAGTFHPSDCTFPSDAHRSNIFLPDQWTARPELKSMISFRHLNLIADWPMSGLFDIIMCRNVAIYFDKPTQAQLWTRFCKFLRPDGHLFIGHSERIIEPDQFGLTLCGTTTYKFDDDLVSKAKTKGLTLNCA
jgi:chemotaxis protein methyltransferase CheR